MNASRIFPLLCFIMLIWLMLSNLLNNPGVQNLLPETNRELPNFSLPVYGKEGAFLSSQDLKGKVSLVHYFATWCGICVQEQPSIAQLSKQLSLPVYGIAWRNETTDISKWLKTSTSPYTTIALDPMGRASIQFGIDGVPQTFLIDKRGHIRFVYKGMLNEDKKRDVLIPLIEKLRNES
jgi:cytochrome c biogenesis protein CcmG/thiol:disulfide interchange protein DsbE